LKDGHTLVDEINDVTQGGLSSQKCVSSLVDFERTAGSAATVKT